MSEVVKLTKGLKYNGSVEGISPCAGGYIGKNNQQYHCHHLMIKVDQFPTDLFKVQICDLNDKFNLLNIGEYFSFIAGTYNMAEDRYTISFHNKLHKAIPINKSFGGSPVKNIDYGMSDPCEPDIKEKKYEPSIAGTPWSICLTAAKDFHKDRKTSKDEDVISTLKAYLKSYNEYLKNEQDYLK